MKMIGLSFQTMRYTAIYIKGYTIQMDVLVLTCLLEM